MMNRSRRFVPLIVPAVMLLAGACAKKRPPAAAPAPAPQTSAPAPTRPAPTDDSAERARLERERLERERLERERSRLAGLRNTVEAGILFEFDRSDLTAEAREALEAKIPIFVSSPDMRIVVEGHADDTGSDEYNLALGQRRAAAAKRYLVQRDVDASRVETASFGEERLACSDTSDSCRARNRRDEFRITAGGPVVPRS